MTSSWVPPNVEAGSPSAGTGFDQPSASPAWEAVAAAIDTGDLELVAERVLSLDDRDRREVAAALPAHLAVAEERAETRRRGREARHRRTGEAAWQEYVRTASRTGRTVYDYERHRWDAPWNLPRTSSPDESWAGPVLVAGAAAINGAAAVVTWLNRRDLQDRWSHDAQSHRHRDPQSLRNDDLRGRGNGDVQGRGNRDRQDRWNTDATSVVLARVLSARPVEWQADFATRAALKLRPAPRRRGTPHPWAGLVLAMLRRTGATPPEHAPLVVAWAHQRPTVVSLREDPLLDHLLPRLFEAAGVGTALHEERAAGLGPQDAYPDNAYTGSLEPRTDPLDAYIGSVDPPTDPLDAYTGSVEPRTDPLDAYTGVEPRTDLPKPRHGRAGQAEVRGWLVALVTLVREGRIGRDVLLDGCLRRFLRGGQAADLRFFVRLHELLAPTFDEVSKRRRDYLRLLPAAPGVVAETALKHVRRLAEPDPGEVTQALRALLARDERKLLTAGLTWLDEFAAESVADLDGLAPALGRAFACESADVQGRAVRISVKHAKRFTPAGVRALREAAGVLPQELGEALAAAFGAETGSDRAEDGFVSASLPDPLQVPPFPAPVMSAAELDGRPTAGTGWAAMEVWLAGVVRLHGADRDGLAGRLAARSPFEEPPQRPWTQVWQWAQEIARLIAGGSGTLESGGAVGGGGGSMRSAMLARWAFGPDAEPEAFRGLASGEEQERSRVPAGGDVPAPHLLLMRRLAEVYDGIEDGTLPPYLLAEPTEGTGHLDAGQLVERLAGYERAGTEAMRADLAQALLRLPREVAPDVVARAGRLSSEAGRVVARWLNGDRPDPHAEVTWLHLPMLAVSGFGSAVAMPPSEDEIAAGGSGGGVVVTRSGDGALERGIEDAIAYRDDHEAVQGGDQVLVAQFCGARLTGLELVDELLSGSVHRGRDHGGLAHWWPYLMPSHREAVAAHLVPYLFSRMPSPRGELSPAEALAVADGPAGEAVALVQAYFMADPSWSAAPEERARPVVEMAVRGELDCEQVGRQLALLVRRAWLRAGSKVGVRMGAVFETLESVAGLGAHGEVWRIMTGFLPVFLPGVGEVPHTRHAQALAFALRAAQWARARGAVGCVAEIARRRASNNFVREARRLHTYLT